MSPVPGDQKGWRPIRNIDRFLQAKGGYLVALKSVLVLLLWILGPFGPPKKRVNFGMFQEHQKCELCIMTPNHLTKINYCCPTNAINGVRTIII